MNRLTDDDRNFGPLTIGPTSWKAWRFVLSSGGTKEHYNHVTIYIFGWVARLKLPPLIKQYKKWINLSGKSWANSPGYLEVFPNEYGFSLSDGFLQIFYGPQTHSSETTKDWCCQLPWTDWTHRRKSYYDTDGKLLKSFHESGFQGYYEQKQFEKSMPKSSFEIQDHDGELIKCNTFIIEQEWTKGAKRFQWLRFFTKPKIVRCLDIEFEKEVGVDKGSWKGGLMGTSIQLNPGELHEEALKRYCAKIHNGKNGKYELKFLKKIENN